MTLFEHLRELRYRLVVASLAILVGMIVAWFFRDDLMNILQLPYFRAVEAIMDEYGGRPHWGKRHYQSSHTLAPRYPGWDAFQRVRRELDPEGRFNNPWIRDVLG